ncbi:MAG: hypothetical protein E7J59_12920 [Enterococcus faecalis]|nr:hypothetical protein [Enterococcus faecalis]
MKISKQFALASCFFLEDKMIRILVLLLAVVTGVASYYLMKKSAAFLPLLKKETATESQQFIERFGRYYLIIAILGVLAAIFNRPLLQKCLTPRNKKEFPKIVL